MRVGSRDPSGNPDPWDVAVLRKTYGRHILGAIAADPGTSYDAAFRQGHRRLQTRSPKRSVTTST